ncbi:MAG: class I SAM-dependent methyltransferase [Syntrophorhabdus sp.]|nr:class I SAM-dependent methyltransferase [Syntrophorhabdus sp.]
MISYLSPAFNERSDEEVEFLRQVDPNSGFSLFWPDLVEPLLRCSNALNLLEIGAYRGDNTRLLEGYCALHAGRLTVVEPTVLPSLREIVDRSDRIELFEGTSHDALSILGGAVDAVMLEGDLNYYAVYHDLLGIEAMAARLGAFFPVIFLRATGWPYARRDMYYNPSGLPVDAVNTYHWEGVSPWSQDLVAGMINYPYANADREGGPRNGVLTAAEDFVQATDLALKILTFPIHNGLSVIWPAGSAVDGFMEEQIGANLFIRLLETVELARLNGIISRLEEDREAASDRLGRWEALLHRMVRRVFRSVRS